MSATYLLAHIVVSNNDCLLACLSSGGENNNSTFLHTKYKGQSQHICLRMGTGVQLALFSTSGAVASHHLSVVKQ